MPGVITIAEADGTLSGRNTLNKTMIEYLGQVNLPNAKLGSTEKTITANEDLRTCDTRAMAREIAHQQHGLITEEMAEIVLKSFAKASIEKMTEGYAVQLLSGDDVVMRIFPDVHIKGGNINLKRAKELMPGTVTDEETMVAHAGELIDKAGLKVSVRAVVQQKYTDMLDKEEYQLKRTGIVTRDFNATDGEDTGDGGSSQGGGSSSGDGGGSNGGGSNGGGGSIE